MGSSGNGAKFRLWAAIPGLCVNLTNSNFIEKGGWKNGKTVKAQCFLTVIFASPLCFYKCKWATVATGWTSVCGLRYHRLCICPKNGLIEKRWVKNCKIFKAQCFRTVIFASPLSFYTRKRAAVTTGRTLVCGLRYDGSCVHPKNGLIEKRWVEELLNIQGTMFSHRYFCLPALFL